MEIANTFFIIFTLICFVLLYFGNLLSIENILIMLGTITSVFLISEFL
ncbi:MAG: hypothetical protein QXL14_00690 [Candidatus Aenigmatarchaeota archaeon]